MRAMRSSFVRRPAGLWIAGTFGLAIAPPGARAQLPSVIDLAASPGTEVVAVARMYGREAIDALGVQGAVALGDFDGDGYGDMIVGAANGNPEGRSLAGYAAVLFGSANVAGTMVDLADGAGASGELRIYGGATNARLGWSVAAADLNGDGYDDAMLGVPGANSDEGMVAILWGGSAFADLGEVDMSKAVGTYGETRIYGDGAGHALGFSIATGDVDADGELEMLVGAIGAFRAGRSLCGEAVLLPGTLVQSSPEIDLDVAVGSLGECRLVGDNTFDNLGIKVAMGDIGGDGRDDLMASSINFNGNAGAAYVVTGSAALFGQEIDFNNGLGTYGEVRIYGAAATDEAGKSIAIGDVDGDGRAEVAVGAWHADAPGRANVGEVIVLPGSTLFSGAYSLGSTIAGEWRVRGEVAGDQLGFSAAIGDVNGDGLGDLLAGSTTYVDLPPARGEVSVLYGAATMPSGLRDLQSTPPDAAVVGDDAGDWFGWGAAAGSDANFDGIGDFAAAAILGDNPNLAAANNSGFAAAMAGAGTAGGPAKARRYQVAGDGAGPGLVPAQSFGPSVRAIVKWMDNDTGSNGSGGPSWTEVQVVRSNAATDFLGYYQNPNRANAYWHVSTNRVGWSVVQVRFRYTDAEIAGVGGAESDLAIFTSASAHGPWVELPTVVDTATNLVYAMTGTLGYFAIANRTMLPVEVTEFAVE